MTTTPHPFATILIAIAEGKAVQWENASGTWAKQSAQCTLSEISRDEYTPDRYRVAPAVITINGHEVPEPLRVMPAEDTQYWLPVILGADGYASSKRIWTGTGDCHTWLKQGLVHLTQEAAEAHTKALLSFTAAPPAP